MKNLKEALNEYETIVKAAREEYSKDELTVDAIRNDHPELNFMDDESIQGIICFANQGRVKQLSTPIIQNNLRKYRIWKNLTQEQFSAEIKISVQTLRLIELYNKYPKYHIRSAICKYFDVTQDQMFYFSA